MKSLPDEAQTLRLLTAFLNIADPEIRRIILAIAEAKASGKPLPVDELRKLTSGAKQS